jgi:hypothetical protein
LYNKVSREAEKNTWTFEREIERIKELRSEPDNELEIGRILDYLEYRFGEDVLNEISSFDLIAVPFEEILGCRDRFREKIRKELFDNIRERANGVPGYSSLSPVLRREIERLENPPGPDIDLLTDEIAARLVRFLPENAEGI